MGSIKAVIFDMDGTMVDNSPHHRKAWGIFCKKYGLSKYSELDKLFGQTNDFILPYFFERNLSQEETLRYADEKEKIYREIYASEIAPIKGLLSLLQKLKEKALKLAVATSANKDNVNFVLSGIKAEHFFDCVIDESYVSNGKPDPEIFLVCAKKLGIPPENCLVFEDSVYGVEAANKAGMKVIALNTTVNKNKLGLAEFVISDYDQIPIEDLLLP